MNIHNLDRKLTIVVTVALMLDWAPAYFFNLDISVYSGTKLVALPLILSDVILNLKHYVRPSYGLLFVIAFLMGIGGGYLDGSLAFGSFWELLPIGPILLFYLKPRRIEDIQSILRTCFICSPIVPIALILAYIGILAPTDIKIGGKELRIVAGTSWSSLGLYVMFIPASLGGILLARNHYRLTIINYFLSGIVLALGFFSLILTGLRSSIGTYIFLIIVSLYLYLRGMSYKFNYYFKMIIPIFTILFIVLFFKSPLTNVAQTSISRFATIRTEPSALSRSEQYTFFIKKVFTEPSILPMGMDKAMQNRGIYSYPHFIIGEAYFKGGLLFMFILLWGFLKGFSRLLTLWRTNKNYAHINTLAMLLSLLIGYMMILSVMPGLHTRLTYIVLGICLSVNRQVIKGRMVSGATNNWTEILS